MAWELEGLIADLLVFIACSGEKGCSLPELVGAIERATSSGSKEPKRPGKDQDEEIKSKLKSGCCSRATSTVWDWIAARRDISIGSKRKYNHLTLHDLLSEFKDSTERSVEKPHKSAQDEKPEASCKAAPASDLDELLISLSEETLWQSLTGHGIDYKRVPPSEWTLLQGIASSRNEGIKQGDLGRLCNQDKRSVPKRTDALQKKGYIQKRLILSRATKTSKLWLTPLAPIEVKDTDITDEAQVKRPDITFSREVLAGTMDPVPWSDRWTGKDIDYIALGSTIVAIAKTWGVIRICDLKFKLGILKMRWQMKVFSRTCRFLNHRGIIRYVAAELDGRVFKDCVRFNRELDEEDWACYHQAGRREESWTRDALDEEDNMDVSDQTTLGTAVKSLSSWSHDQTLPNFVVELARVVDEEKLSNPGLYCLTLGTDFRRYLSSMTASLANAQVQPENLKHLQLRTIQVRTGKVASYRYFLPPATQASGHANVDKGEDEDAGKSTLPDSGNKYGFHLSKPLPDTRDLAIPLSDLCRPKASWHKSGGKTFRALESKETTEARLKLRNGEVPSETTEPEVTLGDGHSDQSLPADIAVRDAGSTPIKVGANTEQASSQTDAESTTTPAISSNVVEVVEQQVAPDEAGSLQLREAEVSSRGRGGTRGAKSNRGKARGRGRGGKNAAADSGKQWKCEKCGGAWKNDIGLKYHVEKSRTPCNPNWDPNQAPAKSGRKPKAAQPDAAASLGCDIAEENDGDLPGSETPRPKTSAILDMGSERNGWRADGFETAADIIKRGNYSTKVSTAKKLAQTRDYSPAEMSSFGQSPTISLIHQAKLRQAPKQNTSYSEQQTPKETHAPLLLGDDQTDLLPVAMDVVKINEDEIRETPATQTATSRSVPRIVKRERITRLLDELLERNEGIFPGGEALYQCVAALWQRDYEDDLVPFVKEMNLSLKYHSNKGRVSEHWKSFRTDKGRFAQCHVISDPSIDAFSPKAVDLMEKIKAAHPRLYLPPSVEDLRLPEQNADKVRGRRVLPEEVAKLSAPVYAAQIAAKREAEELMEEARALKKQKRLSRRYYDGDRNTRFKRRGRKGRRSRLSRRSHILLDHPQADLRFLEPNTRLYEQSTKPTWEQVGTQSSELPYYLPQSPSPSPEPPQWASSPPRYLQAELEGEISFAPEEVPALPFGTILPEVVIYGFNGTWPAIHSTEFERAKTGFTVQGWQPHREWFTWETIVEEIERRAVARHSRRRYIGNHPLRRHRRFKEMVKACLGVEAAWANFFVRAQPGEAGPHNIFVSITSGSQGNELPPLRISWPEDQEYRPEAGKEVGYWTSDGTDYPSSDEDMIQRPRRMRKGAKGVYTRRKHIVSGPQAPVKRVALTKRRLTAIPYIPPRAAEEEAEVNSGDIPDDPNEILAAIIAVRSLLGGLHKSVDWGLLLQIYPHLDLEALRKFWVSALNGRSAYIKKLTQDFQKNFVIAYESDEIAMIDFDDPEDYDWAGLIQWTLQLTSNYEGVHLPPSRQVLDELYSIQSPEVHEVEDWREKWYHPHSSVFGRFELATEAPGALRANRREVEAVGSIKTVDFVYVARSWIRSLCSTDDMKQSPERIKDKFLTLVDNNAEKAEGVLEKAVKDLTKRRIIHKSRRPALGGRPYRLTEWFSSSLVKLSQRAKFQEAFVFKNHMDRVFRRGETLPISYTSDDGMMMALMNMNAHGRIRLQAPDLPYIPYGFEPGNYETRKLSKSNYHFTLEAVPSETYKFNEDIDILHKVSATKPPLQGDQGELPQWTDFFADEQDMKRWGDILGAFCFHASTRGPMRIDGICTAMNPVLEEFEARMISDWGLKTGVLEEWTEGNGMMVGEWWWLAVPWMQRKITKSKSL